MEGKLMRCSINKLKKNTTIRKSTMLTHFQIKALCHILRGIHILESPPYGIHYHMGFTTIWDSRVESAPLSASCSSAQPSPYMGIVIIIFSSQLPYQSSSNTSLFDITLDYPMKTRDVALLLIHLSTQI